MKYIIFLLSFFSAVTYATSIEAALELSGLIKQEIPTGSDWHKSNNANFSIFLKTDIANRVLIESKKECKEKNLVATYKGSTFIGTNNGEFGGSLSVTPSSGATRVLIKDNVTNIVSVKNDLYIFTGLSHMFTDRGALYKIVQKEGLPFAERITLLPGAPEVVVAPTNINNSFYIITSDGLVTFDAEDETLTSLLINQFWGGLYPTSAIFKENQLAIGMRSGVAVIDVNFPQPIEKIQYYTKKNL